MNIRHAAAISTISGAVMGSMPFLIWLFFDGRKDESMLYFVISLVSYWIGVIGTLAIFALDKEEE